MKNLLYLMSGNILPLPITLYHLLKIFAVMLFIVPKIQSQSVDLSAAQADFELRESAYVETQSQNQLLIDQVRERLSQSCDGHVHEVEEEYLSKSVKEAANMEFLTAHLDECNDLFFPPSAMSTTVDICDNGGFESGTTNYTFELGIYVEGSDDCIPLNQFGTPSVFINNTQAISRYEVVDSGQDTLVGIEMTKFGNKALKLNNRYSNDSSRICFGLKEINRMKKEFVVSEEIREFTIWYALVLENPSFGHDDRQPFFSISCDLASSDDLCFDADKLRCESIYTDSAAFCTYDSIDVLDWTCHRIVIPESEIGETATLSVSVADCGLGCHFGYAYIDGICEECTGSSDGDITLEPIDTCAFDTTLCGLYNLPNICDVLWSVVDVSVPGFDIDSVNIDESKKEFCFNLLRSNFDGDTCLNLRAQIRFANSSGDTIVKLSNEILFCDRYFDPYLGNVSVGSCNDNSTDYIFSDDYYYVTVPIQHATGKSWSITQELFDPYPNESAIRELDNGVGNETVVLGPFFIQAGSWEMTFVVDSCIYDFDIIAPQYCSEDCDEDFLSTLVGNIQCTTDISTDISTDIDTWSFDIKAQDGTGTYWIEVDGGGRTEKNKGTKYTYSSLTMEAECIKVALSPTEMSGCENTFYVCPPKPCGVECAIEPIVEEIICVPGIPDNTFNVQVNVDGVSGKTLCYKTYNISLGTSSMGSPLPMNQLITGLTTESFLTIFLCENSNCNSGCSPTPECFKTFYMPKPDFGCSSSLTVQVDEKELNQEELIYVYPNPTSGELFIDVISQVVDYRIVDVTGTVIAEGRILKGNHEMNTSLPKGVYYILSNNAEGLQSVTKLIHL